jgi:dolichol-phosphate mannosyltransferase
MPIQMRIAAATLRRITVISPVHNEEQSIPYFLERLNAVREKISRQYSVDVLFVNNASTDGTLAAIMAARELDASVQVITQSRNFGYQSSLMCGLSHASADAYVIIDVDCEDPPELILEFVTHWEKGADLVYGLRGARPEPGGIVAARKGFYRLTRQVADWEFILDMAEFSLFTDRVKRQVVSHRSTFPFVRSDLAYAGFKRVAIPYARQPRKFGKTHYNLVRMTRFAIAGMLSASTFPLRAIAYFGAPLALLNLIFAIVSLTGNISLAGLAAAIGLNLAFLVLAVLFVAIYLARVTKDVIGRPVFIVDEQNSVVNRVSLQDTGSDIPSARDA